VTDTGRLAVSLGHRTRRTVHGSVDPAELWSISQVDLVHVVMLVEQGLIDHRTGALLLRRIVELRDEEFASLLELDRPRGLYLAYEDHLISRLGTDVGGRLHTGRSRNDLKATTTALALRSAVLELLGEGLRLLMVSLNRARAHRDIIMPVYTHFQAAMPITYGYYLLGIVLAAARDLEATLRALDGLDRCPLGAGAVAGGDLPINPARTAELLGFTGPPVHAIDSVASRDVLLRVVGALGGLGLTLGRLATDLQLWSTAEFGFIHFPERLVGGSSAMPQKRNAFLLEHVKAKSAVVIGAWAGGAAATKSTPFTNSIEVGTEAVHAAWPGLRAAAEAVQLCQVLVSGARPVAERMRDRAEAGYVVATSLANRLVRAGVPFREAHYRVGAAVRRAVERGSATLDDPDLPFDATDLDLATVISAQDQGGGPGAFAAGFQAACTDTMALRQDLRAALARIAESNRRRESAVRGIMAGVDEG
jgi:argininosuccinate lyase